MCRIGMPYVSPQGEGLLMGPTMAEGGGEEDGWDNSLHSAALLTGTARRRVCLMAD